MAVSGAGALLLAGCSGAVPTEESNETPSPQAGVTETASAAPEQTDVGTTTVQLDDVPLDVPSTAAVRDDGLVWHGDVIGGVWIDGDYSIDTDGSREATVGVMAWLPGSPAMVRCDVEPISDGETLHRADLVGVEQASGEVVAHLVYSTTTEATGLDPESSHVYVQPLDIDACDLGERIEVRTGAASTRPGRRNMIVGVDGDIVALNVVPDGSVTSVTVGLSTTKGKVMWQSDGLGEPLPSSGQEYSSVAMVASNEDRDAKTAISVGTGKTLGRADDLVHGYGVSISDGRFVLQRVREVTTRGFAYAGIVFDDGEATTTFDDRFTAWVTLFDTEGLPVMVGTFGWPDGKLAYVGADNALHKILSVDQVKALELELRGGSAGVVYAQTTSESVAFTLDGEEVDGDPALAAGYLPIGERQVGDKAWTLWEGKDGTRVVTVSGEFDL